MESDAEDHNYRHHGYRDTGGGGGGLNGVTISPGDIFQITGSTPAVFVGNLRKLSQEHVHRNPHNHQARHTYHKSQQKTCLTNKNESCRNNNVVISPTDFFQLEQIDDGKPNRGLSLGNLFSTGGSHAYTALTRALDSSTSVKTPVDSCGDSGTLDTTGSTTALLETAGRCSGADKKRRQGEDDECCEPAFLVGWNWPAIRIGCLLLCVSCLVAVLCVVVGVLLLRPTPCDPERSWWQGAVMYEVFVASFVDSDGDGFGDFAGLTSRLGYIRNRIGASAIRLTSVFSALDYPLEYEHIIDFDNVDPHLGHMEDFAIFVERAHEIGLRVVLDINLAVTSDQHSWAAHWLLDPYGEYGNYYVLMNDSSIMSNGGEEEWDDGNEDDEKRDPQRPFGSQLFLNWSHPEVHKRVTRSLSVWLEKGVDGFYLKHLERLQVQDDREMYDILLAWRRLMDQRDEIDGRGRILMTSLNLAQDLVEKDSLFAQPVVALFDLLDVHVPLEGVPGNVTQIFASHFDQVGQKTVIPAATGAIGGRNRNDVNSTSSGSKTEDERRYTGVAEILEGTWINWNLGDSESSRLASRLLNVDPLAALFTLLGLPGTVSIFYGDEIGMKDAFDTPTGRPFRTGQLGPMQWSDAVHGNFSAPGSRPWMPTHPDHVFRNVDNASESIDTLARAAEIRMGVVTLAMSGVPTLRRRKLNARLVRRRGDVFAMERFYPHRARYAVVANFAQRGVTHDISDLGFEGNVVAGTCSSLPTRINFHELYLEPGEALYVEVTS